MTDTDSPNCQLCVAMHLCEPHDPDPKHRGTLLHRCWICTVTRPTREQQVPQWVRREVALALRPDSTMAAGDLLLYTRALVSSHSLYVPCASQEATFTWVVPPVDGIIEGIVYTDGSLLDNHHTLAGLCRRLGWAFVVMGSNAEIVASAHGRPPAWVDRIQGAELWAVKMATPNAMPGTSFVTDCKTVQAGWERGRAWATASSRRYARIWCPILANLDEAVGTRAVTWMPAHTALHDVGVKECSDGHLLTASDRLANAEADRLAKSAVENDRVARRVVNRVADVGRRVHAIATWIGQATVIANDYKAPDGRSLRDAAPRPRWARQPAKTGAGGGATGVVGGSLAASVQRAQFTNPHWLALAERVRQKERASKLACCSTVPPFPAGSAVAAAGGQQ